MWRVRRSPGPRQLLSELNEDAALFRLHRRPPGEVAATLDRLADLARWTRRLAYAEELDRAAAAIRAVLAAQPRASWTRVHRALDAQTLITGPMSDLLERLRRPSHDEVAAVSRRLPQAGRALLLSPPESGWRHRFASDDLLLDADLDRVMDDGALVPVASPDAIIDGTVPLGRAWMQAAQAHAELDDAAGPPLAWHLVGGLRRTDALSPDVSLLAVTEEPAAWIARALDGLSPYVVSVAGTRALALVADPEPIVVHAVTPEALPTSLVWYTGPRSHVQALRTRAVALGLTLTRDAIRETNGVSRSVATEDDVYAALGLAPIPVELRDRPNILARAAEGALPTLVDEQDIRGDLHVHTVYSDGRDSVATMAHAARALGYEYVAITDHSPTARASRVLTLNRIAQQADEIAHLRTMLPDLTILHGIECDIQPDGSLDVADAILERLDLVLASLHETHGDDPSRLLERYLTAVRHPLVNVITHPANRSPGRQAGYALAFERLFEEAARTGTAVEIDGAPGHMDLDAPLAEQAAALGATIVVDSDCHMSERLGRQMRFGVALARRAGLGADQVLNTRGVDGVRAFVAVKRAGDAGT